AGPAAPPSLDEPQAQAPVLACRLVARLLPASAGGMAGAEGCPRRSADDGDDDDRAAGIERAFGTSASRLRFLRLALAHRVAPRRPGAARLRHRGAVRQRSHRARSAGGAGGRAEAALNGFPATILHRRIGGPLSDPRNRIRGLVLNLRRPQMGYKVVVAGATGNVGREMLNILAEREFPVDEIAALASRKSLGTEVSFGDKTLKTKDLDTFDFTGWDIALFAVGSEATKIYAPKAAKAGCVVIDNSSLYRYDPEIPLVVPEVNPEAVEKYKARNIIANPNCSTAQMVVALKPLHDRAKIKRVVVSTYQSVSGAGKAGIDELWDQTKSIYNPVSEVPPKKFTKQIAF